MKKRTRVCACLLASLMISGTALAAKVELYALDGRSIYVEENQVEVYTAPGMGWYSEKPVTMYSLDGRTIVVPADSVEANKEVGWYLENEIEETKKTDSAPVEVAPAPAEKEDKEETSSTVAPAGFTVIEYTDGTRVTVPTHFLETYKLLGWVVSGTGSSVQVNPTPDATPEANYVKVYSYNGTDCLTKDVPADSVEAYKAQGWFGAADEAIYAYAAFGDGKEVVGASELLAQKKYEMAFNMVQNGLDKLESTNTNSEYISLLDYLRSQVTDAWREAANSPLGFINYWFTNRDGQNLVVFEYRNVSNSRINFLKINFDICDKDGNVIEANAGSYYIENIQMPPFEMKRLAWLVNSGSEAASIKNLKVQEVRFSDGTSWVASK